MDEVHWVQFVGNPVDEIKACMRVGNSFGIITESSSFVIPSLDAKYKELLYDYSKLVSVINKTDGSYGIGISNGLKCKTIVVSNTVDRGKVVKISNVIKLEKK